MIVFLALAFTIFIVSIAWIIFEEFFGILKKIVLNIMKNKQQKNKE
jgi:hypothetical protein